MLTEIEKSNILENLTSSLENKNEVMGYDSAGNFKIYKKCLVLYNREDERFSYEPTEIMLPINEYYILKNIVEETGSHYIEDAGVHLFFSVADFWNTMIEAQKHKLF